MRHRGQHDGLAPFSETDVTGDLKIDRPTLFIHGSDDQIVPVADAAERAAKLVRGAALWVHDGAPHGLCTSEADRVNADLLAFAEAER